MTTNTGKKTEQQGISAPKNENKDGQKNKIDQSARNNQQARRTNRNQNSQGKPQNKKPADQSLATGNQTMAGSTPKAQVNGAKAQTNRQAGTKNARNAQNTANSGNAANAKSTLNRNTAANNKTNSANGRTNNKPQNPNNKKTTAVNNTAAKNTKTKADSSVNAKKTTRKPARRGTRKQQKPDIKIIFLGGLNEIGKNITVFQCGNDMMILDCGMAFPDGEMLGVDLVLPDFTFIEENQDKIRGIVLTHGHEDHIGSLPYLLKKCNFPVYGTALTLGLVGNKLKEHNLLHRANLNVIKAGDSVKMGCMNAEFIRVNHSIPDACAIAIHSPAGTIVHTGDFKIDCTPTSGEMIDLSRFAELGQQGVLALLAESTNAERPGYTMTEKKVSESFERLFQRAEKNRIIIATFASNVSRVQQIINCAHKHGRKVAFSGRSMLNYMAVASELGYVDVPEGVVIDIDLVKKYPPEQMVIITTGSQGEPMSALSRMAYSDHRKIEVGAGDFIIISANPIPGNEKTVGSVIDELLKLGCEVVYESMYEVHVSGHACQEELKIIHGLVKPKYFVPVHGEQKHLRKHAALAQDMGMSHKDIFIGDVGNVIEIQEEYMKQLANVTSGKVFVDGLGVGDVGSIVLRDRKHLGQDGLIIIVASIDIADGHVVTGPDIVSRGFVYVRESEALLDEVRRISAHALNSCMDEHVKEWNLMKNKIKEDVSKLIYNKTRRSPMILPIIMEV